MVAPYLWIKFHVLSITYLDTSTLDCFTKSMRNPWYDRFKCRFIVGLRFGGYFHNFYECWMLHNIEGDVCFIKESCPLLVQILFFGSIQSLGQWNLLKGSSVFICGYVRTSMLFVKGWNFEPLPFEMLEQTFLPLKDATFPWPHPLFAHLRYGLVLPCRLLVEGQVHHIGKIIFSPMDVPLNTLQFQFARCHHIDSPNGKELYPCNMK